MLFTIISTCNNGDGYKYCRTYPKHPNANVVGLQALHRVVAENKIGRLLTGDEVVHHKDGDKRNNHPDNLEVMTRSEHCRHHFPKKPKMEAICPECGKKFAMDNNDYRFKTKHNKSGAVHCSRACATKNVYKLGIKKWAASDSN